MVVAANAIGMTLLLVAGLAAGHSTTLAAQVPQITVAVGALLLAAAGDTLFLMSAKEAVGQRCALVDGRLPDQAPTSRRHLDRPAPRRNGEVSSARTIAPSDSWRRHTDRVVAGIAVAAAGAAIAGAWAGLARVVTAADQIPWLVCGGLSGLLLLGIGATTWIAAALRDQWAVLSRILQSLENL